MILENLLLIAVMIQMETLYVAQVMTGEMNISTPNTRYHATTPPATGFN